MLRFEEANLKFKAKKRNLFAKEVSYLGHIVSGEGISTDPAKVEAVCTWPVPQHLTDLRALLGTCGYYRRFVPGYAELARPLNVIHVVSKLCNFHLVTKMPKGI
mgnify:CR=1 FL=1